MNQDKPAASTDKTFVRRFRSAIDGKWYDSIQDYNDAVEINGETIFKDPNDSSLEWIYKVAAWTEAIYEKTKMDTNTQETRQDFLNEAVTTVSKITEQDIATVIDTICAQAKEESKKTDAYSKMFEASHKGLRGILDEANDQMTGVLLNTMDILEEKGLLSGAREDYVIRNRVWYMLKMLPLMCTALEYDIDAREGFSCVKDKVRHKVYETFMDILNLADKKEDRKN